MMRPEPNRTRLWFELQMKWLLMIGAMAAVLFGAAGRWNVPRFWIYSALMLACVIGAAWVILQTDPGLLIERLQPQGEGVDPLLRVAAVPILLSHWVVAGFDVGRFGWSGDVPLGLSMAACLGLAAAQGVALWALAVNRYFVPDARVQTERGHCVVTSGPYRFVRHPGYAAAIVGALCSTVALGSWWSLVPALLGVVLVVRRTLVEDRLLQEQLAGYSGYASRVRSRLIPSIW